MGKRRKGNSNRQGHRRCGVCSQVLTGGAGSSSCCSGAACRNCLRQAYAYQLETRGGSSPLRCIFCQTPVTLQTALLNFPSDSHEKYERWISAAKKPVYRNDLSKDQIRNSQGCPTCHIPIAKTEGCDHMQCRRCGTHFCWLCNRLWLPSHVCPKDRDYNILDFLLVALALSAAFVAYLMIC